jgi:tripartite motif-containing protein 71
MRKICTNVCVAIMKYHRIQKFDSNGNVIKMWGSEGKGDGQFKIPADVSYVYLTDQDNERIQKFTGEDQLITDVCLAGMTVSLPNLREQMLDSQDGVYVAGIHNFQAI